MTRTTRNIACFLTSIAVLTTTAWPAARAQTRDEGLVGYWSFDEGEGGTAYDYSGYDNHGTIYGAAWVDEGISGHALSFDGDEDYVDLGNDPSLYADSMSIGEWVRLASFGTGSSTTNDGSYGDGEWGMDIHLKYSGEAVASVGSGSDNHRISVLSEACLNVGEWYFLVCTYSDADRTLKLYIDGDLVGENSWVYSLDHHPSLKWYIGAWSQSFIYPMDPHYYHGIIDEVRIYDRVLSPEEIQELYSFHGGFSNAFSWASYDAGDHAVGDDPDGYTGAIYDGRYVYFAPYQNEPSEYHSEVLRYDTIGDFDNASSWATFIAGQYPLEAKGGYYGSVFAYPYIYFVPYRNESEFHGEVLRYDTAGEFSDVASWAKFDAGDHGVGTNPIGYHGGIFDGQYVYFAPWTNGSEWHGEVLRYDTEADFEHASSWAAYDPGAEGVGDDPDGYLGGVFDDRYIYFAPANNGSEPHGEVLRYDTAGAFSDVSSWAAYDPGAEGVGNDPDGYWGAVFDSRYVYFVPHDNGSGFHGEVLRYDTTAEFTNASSWATYDAGDHGVGTDPDGYLGAVFDGRYIYFAPANNGSEPHGEVLRYDTAGEFTEASSWATYDPGCHAVGANPEGYNGAVFVGRHVYFSPYRRSGTEYHGEVLRYDTAVGAPGVDVSVSAEDIVLTLIDPDVEAAITVHNLGIEQASDVLVEVFKNHGDSGFVSVGTDVIASIQPASQASTSITFTPDFVGQEIKVVVSLAGVAYDGNPSNNQAIVIWNGGVDEPVVLQVHAERDGNDLPDVAGRYIAEVALSNTFYATVLPGVSHVTGVSFQMDDSPPATGMKQADDRWKATFDMGELEGGVAHTLTVVATDALGNISEPKELAINVIPLPSWAETWNSDFCYSMFWWTCDHYRLAGFIPVEWRLDQTIDPTWAVIGGKMNRFRAGLFTTAVATLDGQIGDGTIDPALYVSVLDGFATVDFTVDGLTVESEELDLKESVDPEDDETYQAAVNVYKQFSFDPEFDTETLELIGVFIGFQKDFEHDPIEVKLTPHPVYFTIGGWPMSFEASMSFTPGVGLCITVYASGEGFEFTEPTYVEPSLNVKVDGTINIIDVVIVAVGASIQPSVTFAYNIAWEPPVWDGDWIIDFMLDICAKLRFGWCPFCYKVTLGCLTVFEHTWYEGDKGAGDWLLMDPLLDPPVDPEGVLNRPVIIGGLGRGERVLVYTFDTVDGPEIVAQVDPGTGTWGPQEWVTTDGLYADLDATLAYTHDGQAMAVWTKVETPGDEIESTPIDELITTFDLYWSIWDGVSWSTEAPLTDDAFADGMAKLAFSDVASNGLAIWCRDEANDFDDVTADEIAYATWDGSTWSAPAYLTADTLGDRQIAACYRTGTSEALAVWTKETDPVDHFLTVYYAEWDGAAWTAPAAVPGVTEEWVAQVNVAPLSDGRVFAAWAVQADDGWQIKTAIFDTTTGWGAIEVVQDQLTLVDGLQLQVSADDVVHVFWHGYTLDDDLFGVSKDLGSRSDTWVGPSTLTSGAEIEWQLTGALDSAGELSLVYAREQGRAREPLPPNRNGLPDELGSSAVPGGGNWTVTDDDLTLLGEPWLHETVTVEAVLTNTGTTDSVQTTAQFWLGDPSDPESTPIGDPIEIAGIPPLETLIIQSEEFSFEEVGHIDVCLVVATPVAELDPTDNQAVLAIDVINNDTTPPQVLETTVTPLRDSERLGARLAVTFDEPMTPPTVQDVLLIGESSGQAVPDQVSVDPTGEVMTVVFEDYLSQDMYTFTVIASRVTDEAGNELDGDGDGTGGDDYVMTFSLLPGDLDWDGDVDLEDYALWQTCLAGPGIPGVGGCQHGDLDGDDDVDLKDFAEFQAAFTGSL